LLSAAGAKTMTAHAQDEYTALRATVRERGTARVCVFVAGVAFWTAATIATATLASTPVATLLPLLLLASVFEAVFALHVGVERIGRYIQVFHETDAPLGAGQSGGPGGSSGSGASGGSARAGGSDVQAGWEHAAMAFGRPRGSAATDPLFSVLFCLGALFNAAPATLLHPQMNELIFVGGAHALFVLRVMVARQSAARQRAIDLERFQQLKRT
jgi:hypothetical protein